jgi:orotidine-5'-phosphate decarboxylase
MTFADHLVQSVQKKRSSVIVGLDPHLKLFPHELRVAMQGKSRDQIAKIVEEYCTLIIEGTYEFVVGVKPQVAFFERLGPAGFAALEKLVKLASSRGLVVISDCKRGDIGSTAEAYAEYHLGSASPTDNSIPGLGADAATLSPYLGADSIGPFARFLDEGRGIFILAKTSNPGSGDLQDRLTTVIPEDKIPIYRVSAQLAQSIADKHAIGDCGYSSVGIVVGATFPAQMAELRDAHPRLIFLLPGIGAQGATASDVSVCFDKNGNGALVSASRSIMFAKAGIDSTSGPGAWRDAARESALALRDDLNRAISYR